MGCCSLKNKCKNNKIEDILEKLNNLKIKDAKGMVPKMIKIQNDIQSKNNSSLHPSEFQKIKSQSNRSTSSMNAIDTNSPISHQ